MAISTNGTVIARLAGALYNQTMSSASYNEVVGSVKSAADINALANSFVSTDFAGKTDAQIATVLLTNLNLTSVAGLNNWVAAQITAAGAAGKGAKIVSLLNDFSNLTTDATYGASASSFNTKVDSALALSQTAGFKGGDLNAAATIAAAEKAVADAAAKKISDDAAAKKIIDDAAAKKIIDDAAAKKILDDAAAKKIVDDAAAKKIVDDKAAAEKILTDAATKAATDASAAIDAATVADAALATAQTALATATTKAALTDATVLASTTKTLTDAITAATTVKTNADKAVVDANTAYTAALNATTPVSADVVNTNAAVLISTNKAVVAAKALADATAAAALAKTASDAATADDASAVTAQTAVDTSAAAATKAAAAAVASVATSKTAAAATAATADDAVATTAATVAAGKGAGAAKIVADAAKVIADKVISDKVIADKVISDKVISDKVIADKVISDKVISDKVISDKVISDKVIADKVISDKVIADALAIEMAPKSFTLTTGADVYVGGKGTNTVTAVIGTDGLASNGTSLNAGDNITGGVGNADTLSVNITGNNTGLVTTAAVTLSAVENITVTNYETTANDNSINLSLAPGVAKISVLGSSLTGDTLFTGARGLVTAEMGNGNGDLSITYVDTALAATTDVQTLNLTGQTGGSFSALPTTTGVAAAETVTITSGTSANTVLLNVPGATTINVSGASNLTLTESMTNTLTSVNATGFTGALNITTDDVTAINVVGGSGADTITLGTSFGTTDTINGGGGDDTLSIAMPVASAAALAGVTSVEALTVTSGDLVSLAANVSPTTFNLAQSTAVANTLTLNTGYTNATTVNLGAGDTVTNSANAVLTLNATDAGMIGSVITGGTAADTLNLTASAATTVVTLNTQAIRVDTINIVDGGDTLATAGRDISITAGAAATSVTVNASALDAGVTGATDITGENLTYVGSGVTTATVVQNVTGGGGNDNISGGAGNDIISGGSGADTLSGGTGNDSINAGLGDDTINMGSTLTSADSIDGGDGADKLILTTIPALSLTNVSNVETLVLATAGAASLSANVSFTTVDMDDGDSAFATLLTLATGYTNATTVLVDAGDSVTNTANVALTITATDAKMTGTTITGGTGADTLNITATALHAGAALTLASLVTNVETINLLDGGDVQANTLGNTVTAGSDVSLTVGNYASAATVATTLTVDASTLDAGTVTTSPAMDANYENATINGSGVTNVLVKLVLTGGGGADSLTGGAGNDVIVGGAGNDQITAGTGIDNLSGGDDIDTFVMAGALTFQDTISGGTGVDIITTTTAVDSDFTNVTLVETLTVTGATTLGAAASAAGIVTLNTGTTAALINVGTMTTPITLNVTGTNAAQTQSITGGTGADTFNFGLLSVGGTQDSLDGLDVVAGGTGSDTIFVSNSLGTVAAVLDLNTGFVTSVENITLGTAGGLLGTTAQTIGLTINDITLTTVQTVNISAAAITDVNDVVTITNNVTTTTGGTTFSITGGAGADVLNGSVFADTINGGGGGDSIIGGTGADSLTGAGGNDIFAQSLTSSTNLVMDTVSDFATGADVIQINVGTTTATTLNVYDFTNKGSVTTNADALTLLSGFGAPAATTVRIGQYVFNTATNTMLMDSDGNGMMQSGDFAVKLSNVTALAAADVSIVVTAGAAAAQTITTGGGNDTITFGAITAVASITAGAGDDTLNSVGSTGTLDADDVIIGGIGIDTLNITDAGTVTLTTDGNLATVERIVLAGAATTLNLTGQTEAFHITTANGANAVTLGTAGTTTGALGSTVIGGTAIDTITAVTRAVFAASSINGGADTDIVNIGTVSTAIVDADFVNHRLVETLGLTGASSVVLGANATTAGITTVVAGAGVTSINSTQTALAVTSTLVTGTLGAITLLGSANYTVAGGTQANPGNITATGSTGSLTATFEDDTTNNVIAVAAGTGNVVLTGVGSTDTITVTGLATAGQTFTGNAGTSVIFAVTAGANAQSITTGAGADSILGGAGADTISSGTGVDQLVYATAGDATGDVIDAGGGTDVLVVTAAMDFTGMATTTLLTAGGVEQILITADTISTFTGTQLSGQAIAINETTTGTTGVVIQVAGGTSADFSALTFAQATMAGSARDAFDDGVDTIVITTGATATSVVGTSSADSITGGAGDDTITGGVGVDSMAGGLGADVFVFSGTTPLVGTSAMKDLIDGGGGTDSIRLDGATTIGAGDLMARFTNVEKITASPTIGAISITATSTGNNTFASTSFNFIDLSGDTNDSGTNVVSLTGATTGITSVTGSAGVDQITLGTAQVATTVTGGAGVDALVVLATTTVVYATLDAPAAAAAVTGTNLAPLATGTHTGYETITGLLTGSVLNLGNASLVVDGNAGTTGTVEANEFLIVQGAWSSGVFTVGTSLTTGADSLILYDGSSATGVQIQGIVLIGVTNAEEANIVNTLGILTVFGA